MLQIKQKNAGSRPEWLVSKRYTFGSGADNNYKVSGDGVNALQAALEVNGDEVMLFNLGGGDVVTLNGELVERRSQVKANDLFKVGDAVYLIEDPKEKRAQKLKNTPKQEPAGWRLKAKNTALANRSFDLNGEMTIGRSNDCDICLNVVHLSRKHAKVSVSKTELRVDDMGSSNGTFVNGNKIESALVKPGDELRFDTLKFTVIGPDDANLTKVRPGDDSDATTLRPAVGAPIKPQNPARGNRAAPSQSAPRKPKSAAGNNKVLPSNAPHNNTSRTSDELDTSSSGNNNAVWVLVLLVIVAAGAAYWFLGR